VDGPRDGTGEGSSRSRDGAPEAGLPHLDAAGHVRMVDVSAKPVTDRSAAAAGKVLCGARAVELLRSSTAPGDGTGTSPNGEALPKGDALAVARIAGIQAAKRTGDLIPLAHPLAVHGAAVDLDVVDDGVEIRVTVRTAGRTGVEMEALTGVAVAALALVDMIKAVDRRARITDVRVVAKSGGRSGEHRFE